MRFFRNRGDGTFEDRTDERRPRRRGGRPQHGPGRLRQRRLRRRARAARRVDGPDGRFPLSLLRNNGDGTFTDVTKAAGLLRASRRPRPRPGSTTTATAGSTSSWATRSAPAGRRAEPLRALPQQPRRHVHRRRARGGRRRRRLREGRRERRLRQRRPARPLRLGAGRRQPALPQRRAGERPSGGWRFTDVAEAAGVTEPISSFGAFFFDYDNDGWLDLFVAGWAASRPRRWRPTWPPTISACRPRPSGDASTATRATAPSRT